MSRQCRILQAAGPGFGRWMLNSVFYSATSAGGASLLFSMSYVVPSILVFIVLQRFWQSGLASGVIS